MKLHRLLILASCLLLTTALAAQDYPLVSAFNDNYVITGITTRDGKTIHPDVRFQASLLVRPFRLSEKWRLAFAFTMRSVWDAYDKSAPFRDNTYQPGLYFIRKSDSDSRLTLAFEHRSNGRPYFGNPLAAEGLEDYSRGMNYILTQWEKQWGKSVLLLQGRIGVGCGVGDYRRHETWWSLDLFKYLHPIVFSFGFSYPYAQYILDTVYIIAQDHIDSTALCLHILSNIDIKAVYEKKRIEFLQRTALPFSGCVYYPVCDRGDGFGRYLKSVYLLDGIGYVPLAHSSGVHAQNLVLDPADILCALRDQLRLKAAVPIPRGSDGYFSYAGSHSLVRVSVSPIGGALGTPVIGFVTQMTVHLPLEHSLKHGTEYVLQSVLHLLRCRRLVFLQYRFGDSPAGFAPFIFLSRHFCSTCSFLVLSLVYRTL